uniref:DUF4515 domain-containing protein n=1 Tax=Pelusios castaneus TaxID=367368 RepID=A0A8C8S583_9SAUR
QAVKKRKGDLSKARSSTEPFVIEREQYLQKEYRILTEHMNMYMKRVEHFLWENEFLDKEALKIREDSKAYVTYITKHTQKCQNAIITLNDQNHFDLTQVQKQKEELISQYTDKEKEVRKQLMEMETKYSLMNKEVEDLQLFKDLQLEQLSRIKELEKELLDTMWLLLGDIVIPCCICTLYRLEQLSLLSPSILFFQTQLQVMEVESQISCVIPKPVFKRVKIYK